MNAYLGIDVSKGYADFLLLNGSFKKLEEPFQLDDTRGGHETLAEWLSLCAKRHGVEQFYAAVESTGGFENNWHASLSRLGETLSLKVARLNPSVVKDAAKATLRGQVTDALSARNIASYLVRYPDLVDYRRPDDRYRAYRGLDNHIELLTKQKVQLVNELKQLLYSCFPELQRFCKKGVPDWVLELLVQYPAPEKLARGKKAKVARIKGITPEKAEKLIERAKCSVGSGGLYTDAVLVRSTAEDIGRLQRRIRELKDLLTENCRGPETELLETIVGIGAYSAARIMVQIEDISRFPSPKHLVGYFGAYPTLKESGDKSHLSRMSKKGRPAIRAVLYMCANTAVLHDPHMKSIYHGHRAKGKGHNPALGVIMHKLLRIIWGVLTSGKAYDPQTDRANQAKTEERETSAYNNEKSKRRMQQYDEDAPISRMASRRRKAHQTSQTGSAGNARDHVGAQMGQT